MSDIAESLRTAAEALLDAASKMQDEVAEPALPDDWHVEEPKGQTRPIFETYYKGVMRRLVPLTWKRNVAGRVLVVALELSRDWADHPAPMIKCFHAANLTLWDTGDIYTFEEPDA